MESRRTKQCNPGIPPGNPTLRLTGLSDPLRMPLRALARSCKSTAMAHKRAHHVHANTSWIQHRMAPTANDLPQPSGMPQWAKGNFHCIVLYSPSCEGLHQPSVREMSPGMLTTSPQTCTKPRVKLQSVPASCRIRS